MPSTANAGPANRAKMATTKINVVRCLMPQLLVDKPAAAPPHQRRSAAASTGALKPSASLFFNASIAPFLDVVMEMLQNASSLRKQQGNCGLEPMTPCL